MNERHSPAWLRGLKTTVGILIVLGAGGLLLKAMNQGRPAKTPPGKDTWIVGDSEARVKELAQQYQAVSFGLLSDYFYHSPDPWATPDPTLVAKSYIPEDIKAFNGKPVAISGFLMPLKQESDGITEFVLNGNYDMCGFGGPVSLNEWMIVKYIGRGKVPYTHLPITVFGILDVGEERQDGRVISLYRMQAKAVSMPGGVIE